MNAKQRRFVDEYLIDLNATQAAVRAGYSVKTAQEQGSRLLSNAMVADAIAAGAKAQSERTGVTADVVLGELLRLARVDLAGAYDQDGTLKPIHEMPEDVRRAIAGIEVDEITEWVGEGEGRHREVVGYTRKVKFWDKRGSLELLGKHLKLFTDKVEHSGDEAFATLVANAFSGKAKG